MSGEVGDAIKLHQARRLKEAAAICHDVIERQPNNTDALHLLGVIAQQTGRPDEALSLVRRAIHWQPLIPHYHDALGVILQQLGRLDEALEAFDLALQLKPDLATAHLNRGFILQHRGCLPEALDAFDQAVRINPDYAQAHFNRGVVLGRQGRLEQALASYDQALRVNPDFVAARVNRAKALEGLGRFEQALEASDQALRIKPDLAEAHASRGDALMRLGRSSDALAAYDEALRIKPDFAQAHFNRGCILAAARQLEQAVIAYEQAVLVSPDYVDAHIAGGLALQQQGKPDDASQAFERALAIDPDCDAADFALCMCQLPIIYSSAEEIPLRRQRYHDHLQRLASKYQRASPERRARAASAIGTAQPFYLAYQDLNDRPLQEIYGGMVSQLMASRYPQWVQPLAMPPADGKVRVGLISKFFCHTHAIWKLPLAGWIEGFDRNKFELFGYHTDCDQDQATELAERSLSKFVQGPLSVRQWCEVISQDRLHVILTPEFGAMDSVTLQLSSLRLAPIQMTSLGHPVTSGLPTVDYFLSSELMEPEDGQDHYTEELIRLPNSSIYYVPLEFKPRPIEKSSLGIKEDEVLFWCCQSLYKYLPQYDIVYARIAELAKRCKFVFIASPLSDGISQVFGQRLRNAFAQFQLDYEDYCVFVPFMDAESFMGTTAIADVFLDSIGWNGNNSSLEAIAYDVPIVTLPTATMRGRHSTAHLKLMGLEELIASSVDDYVRLAVRLARDPAYRGQIAAKIAVNKHKLYRDPAPIRALENLILSRVRAGGRSSLAIPA
jgi:protein O-GlcNAc transferase